MFNTSFTLAKPGVKGQRPRLLREAESFKESGYRHMCMENLSLLAARLLSVVGTARLALRYTRRSNIIHNDQGLLKLLGVIPGSKGAYLLKTNSLDCGTASSSTGPQNNLISVSSLKQDPGCGHAGKTLM